MTKNEFQKLKGKEKRIMNDWMVKRPQMFYICKEIGEQCTYATENGYCQMTACIIHYVEKRKDNEENVFN